MLHMINQLRVGLPCKYPNESSFIKWLNGPDKSPNEEINNSVIVTLLILIRPSCSALTPARRRPFFTVLSSACQHCCRFFFSPPVLEALWWIAGCCLLFFWKRWKGFCGLLDAVALPEDWGCSPWHTLWFPVVVYSLATVPLRIMLNLVHVFLRQHLKVAPFNVQGGTLVAPQPLVALFKLESWNGGPFFCRAINTAESTAVKKKQVIL